MANFDWMNGNGENRLDRLFRGYADAAVVPEPNANFSAKVWEAVESKRSTRIFGIWAKFVTSGALAASLLLGVLSSTPPKSKQAESIEPEYLAAYLEQPASAPEPGEMLSSILEADPQD